MLNLKCKSNGQSLTNNSFISYLEKWNSISLLVSLPPLSKKLSGVNYVESGSV